MIEVPIKINADTIGTVEIRRIHTRANGLHYYDWHLYEGGTISAEGALYHAEEMGAYVLVAAVMNQVVAWMLR
ncbi:hypothetical protein EniyanLRS_135 [Mycobacterium phage EniyanLRS]|uniref:Uncharacterized protein n=1 Tax=Mycobacterium phage EniyanLRS TaxID=1933770 RepID=A0A2I2MPK6_9CAUD|nr:hypothetical protein EniyanLRS_135 [Mycobacterium phage EniyanLRS]